MTAAALVVGRMRGAVPEAPVPTASGYYWVRPKGADEFPRLGAVRATERQCLVCWDGQVWHTPPDTYRWLGRVAGPDATVVELRTAIDAVALVMREKKLDAAHIRGTATQAIRLLDHDDPIPAAPVKDTGPPVHRLAALFPLLDEPALDALASDIAEHGLREPIVLWHGQVLDGRNRLAACQRAGVEPVFRQFDEETEGHPVAWVASRNLHRRHLDPSQRALVAARLVDANADVVRIGPGRASEKAAALVDVSPRSVEHALAVVHAGNDELEAAVAERRVPVAVAAELAALPPEQQAEVLAAADPKAITRAARKVRETKREAKRKAAHDKALEAAATAQQTMPGLHVDLRRTDAAALVEELRAERHKVGVVHADPPWRYSNAQNGAADQHYEGLGELTIAKTLSRACDLMDSGYLLVWCTNPMLESWMVVFAARQERIEYRTMLTWPKLGRGIGYHAIGDTEHLLVYTVGNPPLPGNAVKPSTWQEPAEREAHSGKPGAVLERALLAYSPPGGVVLDLYAGLGSMALAALRTGRRYLGAELDERRHAQAMARIAVDHPARQRGLFEEGTDAT